MRRFITLMALLIIVGCSLTIPAFASEAITEEEVVELNKAMTLRDYGCPQSYELIFGHTGHQSIIYAQSGSGYIIMDRNSGFVYESGEGKGPYGVYEGYEKHYGGIGCSVVKTESGYMNTKTNEVYDTIPHISDIEELLSEHEENNSDEYGKTDIYMEATSGRLDYSYQDIQRRAFGINNNNTCTAVACGVALTYLDNNVSDLIVPDNMEAETFTRDDNYISSFDYKNARALHKYLYSDIGMPGPFF